LFVADADRTTSAKLDAVPGFLPRDDPEVPRNDDGAAGVPANLSGAQATASDDARAGQWREIGLGAQILRDLGVTSIRLSTDNPRTYVGLSGFGIEIAAVEPIDA
jgi:hypothetical protein